MQIDFSSLNCLEHVLASPLCMNMTNHNNTMETWGKAGIQVQKLTWNKSIGAKAVINDNVNSHKLICTSLFLSSR